MLSKPLRFQFITAFLIALLSTASLCYAQPGGGREPHGPPTEALEACAELMEGDSCSFTGRRDDIVEGTCILIPKSDDTLACAPEGRPPHERNEQ